MDVRCLLVLVMLAAPVSGSLIESSTGGVVSYQFDGGTDRDAPDTCEEAESTFAVPLGNVTRGFLVPGDDEADHYVLDVNESLVGSRVTVHVHDSAFELGIALDVHVPGCEGSVMDDDQQPAPPPAPPQPGEGEQQAGLSNLDDAWECDASTWFFVINQIRGGAAPASIHVIWTDGSRADLPLAKDTPATIAQYSTGDHLGVTVHSAYAILPEEWNGRFNIGRGPCDAQDGEAVFGEPSVGDETTVTFTPTQVGTYVAAVQLAPVLPEVSFGPQPASCHTCVDGSDEPFKPMTYLLEGDTEHHA